MSEKEEFTRYFREVQPKFSRLFARILIQADLTLPQFALLSQLVHLGVISMTEVSEKLHITKPAVTHLVDRLEKNKFLKRLPHSSDRRISLLQVQPKGTRIVRDTQSYVLRFLLRTLDELNSQERKAVSRFYSLLSQTLDEALSKNRERK
ncbi:MAG: MarR family transcriptional regulator [Candidatus Omnitrophica bacterium]|nr:MarR family transcriptional regulator [Candidatus Omnitrophota bacterium]